MTIEQVLAQVDEIKPNTYDDSIKIRWLSELDGTIFNDVVLTHERDKVYETQTIENEDGTTTEEEVEVEPSATFAGYDETTDYSTELIAPFPYDKMYRDYIFAEIDYSNGESERYANSSTLFNAEYKTFCDYYNRTHLPVSVPMKLF